MLPTAQAVLTAERPGARVPGRGADDAGAGAEESDRRRRAGRGGDRGQREGGAARHGGARTGRRAAGRGAVRRCWRSPSAAVEDRARAARILGRVRRRRRGGGAAGGRRRRAGGACAGRSSQAASGARRRARRGGAGGVRGGARNDDKSDEKAAARAADLARILPAGGEADARAPRADAVAALRAALGADRPFELRARAVVALGALGAEGATARRRSPRRRRSPTIRSCAIWPRASSAISRTPARPPTRGPVLRAALDDQDPARARDRRARVWRSRGTPRRAARSSPAPSRSRGRSCGAPSCRRSGGCAWRAAAIS